MIETPSRSEAVYQLRTLAQTMREVVKAMSDFANLMEKEPTFKPVTRLEIKAVQDLVISIGNAAFEALVGALPPEVEKKFLDQMKADLHRGNE